MAKLPVLRILLYLLSVVSWSIAYTELSKDSLRSIPRPGTDFDIKNGKLLSPILQPRVPGTPGSTAVLAHLADFFRNELPQWSVSFQNSTSKTPKTGNKDVPFRNLIVKRDPPWSSPGEVGYLTLVAHYDSKLHPDGFIGAIDSALPCAVLLHAARSLDGALTRKWASMKEVGTKEEDYEGGFEEHRGIQIIFLDGEEAFDVWSSTDSIYGAKSLAADMESSFYPALSTFHNALSSISLFVLLDLLGSANPSIPSYFKTTHWAYKRMASVEQRLREEKALRARAASSWFPESEKTNDGRWLGGAIGDDHVPFMARGVEVLHIIPVQFPRVWHTMDDDGEHLDMPTSEDWAVVVTAFAAEWMDLDAYMVPKTTERRDDGVRTVISKTEL